MAELIPRVGANLVGVHHRLLLVIPELSEIAVFSVADTKPNGSQHVFEIFDNILPRCRARAVGSYVSKQRHH